MEPRCLLSAAFDTVGLTALRADPAYSAVDGSGVGVAILDTGLYAQHPDIAPNFVAWYDAVRRTSVLSEARDPEGHGTHVAGTAAARNPAIGVATRARLISVRVLPADDEQQPRYDTVAEGLQWVIDHQAQYNIRVVNMSLGVPGNNFNSVPGDSSGEAALIHRLEGLGVTVVSASGNSYADFAAPGESTPAAFSTLSVASTWEDDGVGDSFPFFAGGGGPYAAFEREGRRDRLAASSQRSSLPNQVAAPGQTIYSAWNNQSGNLYNTISGTSMASPLVTGMVALMQDAAKTFGGRYLSTSEVVNIVRQTADTITDSSVASNGRIRISDRAVSDLAETGLSFKRVNIYSAVRRVRMFLTGTMDTGPITGDIDRTAATAIVLGSTDGSINIGAEGAIGTDGSIAAGNADVDLYRFDLASRGMVSLTLSNTAGGTAFNPFLRLFNAAGTQLASNDDSPGGGPYPKITTPILEAGTYYAGVSAAPNSGYNPATGAGTLNGTTRGDYQLVISLSNPDPNGVATGAVAVDKLPKLLPGNIGQDRGVPVGSQDVDFFLVTAPDDGTLTLDVNTDAFGNGGVDAVLRVFDEGLNQLAINDDRDPDNIDPLLNLPVVKGHKYFIAVADYHNQAFDPRDPFGRSPAGTGGDYELTIGFDNGDQDGTVFDARPLSAAGSVDGVIGADTGAARVGADGSKDVDFFRFTASADGVLDLQLTSPDGSLASSLTLWEYDAAADDVLQIGSVFGSAPVLRSFVSSGHTYYLSVTGTGNSGFDWFAPATGMGGDTGNYHLQSALRPLGFARTLTDDSVRNNTPVPVTVGSQVSARIDEDSGFVVGADDVDVYRFVAAGTQRIVLRTLCNQEDSTDTVLRIFDSAGRQLAVSDDTSATDRGSRIAFTVQAGQTYYIGVNGYSATATAYDVLTGARAAGGREGSYVLLVMPGAAAEVDLAGLNGIPIVSGDSTPLLTDGTRFGQASVGVDSVLRTFTIYNTGNRVLNLTGTPRVVVSGAQASEFVVVTQPASTVAHGASTTFTVRFSPGAAGLRRATITIASNDLDEAGYTFAVAGQGVLRPEIDVTGGASGGTRIASGDSTPRPLDGTSFGTLAVGAHVQKTFRVRNLGRRVLTLTGVPRVMIAGEHASDFALLAQPGPSISAGAFSTFTIRFTAGGSGARTATILIMSNDGDEPLYTFTVRGAGQA